MPFKIKTDIKKNQIEHRLQKFCLKKTPIIYDENINLNFEQQKTAIKQTSCVEILIHILSCLQIILHPCLGYFPFGQFLIVWDNCLQCFVAHGNAGSPLGIRLSPPDSHWYRSSDHVLNRSLKQIQQDFKNQQVQILPYITILCKFNTSLDVAH